MKGKEDTICAPASGKGGAISVIRISGPDSISICDSIFTPADSRIKLSEQMGYTIVYGSVTDGRELVDEVLVSLFRSPNSYTGEDSAEISCHASPYIQSRILELLLLKGARLAQPGEYTMRAFMNGKIDLSQAEAVADLIASSSEASHRLAIKQMRGGFSKEIAELRRELLHFVSLIELELDFGEEDVEFADRNELAVIVDRVIGISRKLASSFRVGNAIKNGVPVAIIGKPNSGKSTLLNVLLEEDRAIVSEIPGTTRDAIEDTITIDGVEFRFIDTAGIRETTDIIESIGIRKTHEKIDQASIVLLVDDIEDDPGMINSRREKIRSSFITGGKRLILVINKCDLDRNGKAQMLKDKITINNDEALFFLSAKYRTGIPELKNHLRESAERDMTESGDVIVTSMRHYEALNNICQSLERVREGLAEQLPEDLIATDIRQALHYLGEISGEITTDEILGNIFRNFCIGK